MGTSPLKDTDNILFFKEFIEFSLERKVREFVALLHSKHMDTILAKRAKGIFLRWRPVAKRAADVMEDVTILAAALIERREGVLDVTNLASTWGYGPTLYAALIQLAKEEGLEGVISSTPASPEAKPMLRCFTTDYEGKIAASPTDKTDHSESWLNCSLSLVGRPFMELASMRKRYSEYLHLEPDSAQRRLDHKAIRHEVFDKAHLSVAAHVRPS